MTGFVSLVGAGPGDPELITLRGWRRLQAADVVLYDSLVDERLLDGLEAERIFVGKRCGRHAVPQDRINDLLLRLARAGKRVVRLKGGDPLVFGRGGEEARHLAAHGVPFEIVPGVTSAVAGPAYAGIPVTHRGVADSVCVVSAHRMAGDDNFSIPPYHPRTTLVLLMATRTLPLWRRQLQLHGYPADLPVALVSAATTDQQRVLTTTVARVEPDARAAALDTPMLAVVGHVVDLRAAIAWFEPLAARLSSA